jgi:SSS family solute:Na+ symporter
LDYIAVAVIVTYLIGVTVVGALMARRSRGSSDWAVASGGMSGVLVAFGLAGARIGGAGTYGVAGDVVSGGVWNMWWYGISSFAALVLVGVGFAAYYRRLQLQTVGELFLIRFGSKRCQWLTSLCVQTEYAIIIVIEAYVIGVIISSLTPLSMLHGTLIAALVLATYVSLGGLWGTSVTNVIHCTVILGSLLAVGVMGLHELGGWESVTQQVSTQLARSPEAESQWWGFAGGGWVAILAMFFSASVHSPAASIYANYSTATRTERSLVPAFIAGGAIAALMPVLAGLVGILTVARFGPDTGLAGYRNLTAFAAEISPVMGGITLAAVLAAVISSGGPILLSSATMFVRDWVPAARDYSSERRLRAYRAVTVVFALVSALIAWWIAMSTRVSILDLLLFAFAMVLPAAIVVAFVLYWRRTTEQGAYWGMLAGYVAGVVWFVVAKWALWVGLEAPEGATGLVRLLVTLLTGQGEGLDPAYVTTVVPLVTVPIVSLLTEISPEREAEFRARLVAVPDAG